MNRPRHPKDLFCELYAPGRRLVQFSVTLKNVPGAIGHVASTMAEMGISILSGFHTVLPAEREARWSFFAEFIDNKLGPEDVIDRLKRLATVSEISFSKPQFPGLIIDELHFPLLVLGERSVTLSVASLGAMFERIREVFGSGGEVVLYEMGRAAGERKARLVQERFGLAGEDALKVIMAERIAKGWGVPTMRAGTKNWGGIGGGWVGITVAVHDLFECLPFQGKMTKPTSHLFRGYLTGVMSVLFASHITVLETECIAKGDAECVFTTEQLASRTRS